MRKIVIFFELQGTQSHILAFGLHFELELQNNFRACPSPEHGVINHEIQFALQLCTARATT